MLERKIDYGALFQQIPSRLCANDSGQVQSSTPREHDTVARLRSRTVTNEDGTFVVLENDGIGSTLLDGRRWEPHFASLVAALRIEGTTALDIGANIGCNTVHLARAVGDSGLVVAFEPQRIPFQQLCGTIILSGFWNVLALQQAVGASPGTVKMQPVNYFQESVNIGNTAVGQGGEEASMIRLDDFGLQNVSFIKLDVQGSEPQVIMGARNLIERDKPLIFLEVEEDQLRNQKSSSAELIELVFSLGYFLIHIRNEYPVDFLAVPLARRAEADFFARACGHPVNICMPG